MIEPFIKIKLDGSMWLTETREAEVTNPEPWMLDMFPAPVIPLPGFKPTETFFLAANMLTVGITLTHLPVITQNVVVDSGTPVLITPYFPATATNANITPASNFPPLIWPVPPSAKLMLFLQIPLATPARVWSLANTDTFLLVRYASKWFRLPLPNIFDDGRVCMGSRPVELAKSATWPEFIDNRLAWFNSNPWNADLLTDDKLTKIKKLFRFKVTNSGLIWYPAVDFSEQVMYPTVPVNLAKILEVMS